MEKVASNRTSITTNNVTPVSSTATTATVQQQQQEQQQQQQQQASSSAIEKTAMPLKTSLLPTASAATTEAACNTAVAAKTKATDTVTATIRTTPTTGSGASDQKQILIPISCGSCEVETILIATTLQKFGAIVVLASVNNITNETRKDEDRRCIMLGGFQIMADMGIETAIEFDWDLIVIPGGERGALRMRQSKALIQLLERQKSMQKFYAASGASPVRLLAEAGLAPPLLTCYPTRRLRNRITATNIISDDDVVVYNNVITSQGQGSALLFAIQLGELLYEDTQKSSDISRKLLFDRSGRHGFRLNRQLHSKRLVPYSPPSPETQEQQQQQQQQSLLQDSNTEMLENSQQLNRDLKLNDDGRINLDTKLPPQTTTTSSSIPSRVRSDGRFSGSGKVGVSTEMDTHKPVQQQHQESMDTAMEGTRSTVHGRHDNQEDLIAKQKQRLYRTPFERDICKRYKCNASTLRKASEIRQSYVYYLSDEENKKRKRAGRPRGSGTKKKRKPSGDEFSLESDTRHNTRPKRRQTNNSLSIRFENADPNYSDLPLLPNRNNTTYTRASARLMTLTVVKALFHLGWTTGTWSKRKYYCVPGKDRDPGTKLVDWVDTMSDLYDFVTNNPDWKDVPEVKTALSRYQIALHLQETGKLPSPLTEASLLKAIARAPPLESIGNEAQQKQDQQNVSSTKKDTGDGAVQDVELSDKMSQSNTSENEDDGSVLKKSSRRKPRQTAQRSSTGRHNKSKAKGNAEFGNCAKKKMARLKRRDRASSSPSDDDTDRVSSAECSRATTYSRMRKSSWWPSGRSPRNASCVRTGRNLIKVLEEHGWTLEFTETSKLYFPPGVDRKSGRRGKEYFNSMPTAAQFLRDNREWMSRPPINQAVHSYFREVEAAAFARKRSARTKKESNAKDGSEAKDPSTDNSGLAEGSESVDESRSDQGSEFADETDLKCAKNDDDTASENQDKNESSDSDKSSRSDGDSMESVPPTTSSKPSNVLDTEAESGSISNKHVLSASTKPEPSQNTNRQSCDVERYALIKQVVQSYVREGEAAECGSIISTGTNEKSEAKDPSTDDSETCGGSESGDESESDESTEFAGESDSKGARDDNDTESESDDENESSDGDQSIRSDEGDDMESVPRPTQSKPCYVLDTEEESCWNIPNTYVPSASIKAEGSKTTNKSSSGVESYVLNVVENPI